MQLLFSLLASILISSSFISVKAEAAVFTESELRVLNNTLYGTWKTDQNLNDGLFYHQFSRHQGTLKYQMTSNSVKGVAVVLDIYDGEFMDNNLIRVKFDLELSAFKDALDGDTFTVPKKEVRVYEYLHFTYDSLSDRNYPLNMSLIVDFGYLLSELNREESNDVGAQVFLKFFDANDSEKLVLEGNLRTNYSRAFLILMALLSTVICSIKLYATWKLIWQSTENYNTFKKLSISTIVLIFTWDSAISRDYFMVIHSELPSVTSGLLGTISHFAILSETILCGIIWSQSIVESQSDNVQGSRYVCKLFGVAVMVVIGCSIVSFLIENFYLDYFKLIMSFYLVPQIFKNVKELVPYDYNFTFFGYNLYIFQVVFLKGISFSDASLKQIPGFSLILLVIFVTQHVIIYLQVTIDPRFFIPASWYELTLSYTFRNYEETEDKSGNEISDCSICLHSLAEAPPDGEQKKELRRLINALGLQNKSLMKTKCNHTYHIRCLVEWIESKAECPICRSKLDRIL